jgi:hypothetical protein
MKNWKDDKILLWLDIFSRPDSSFRKVRSEEDVREWQPQSKLEREAFEALIADENRHQLKAWYAQFPSINPAAEAFRQILQKAIKEELRWQKGSGHHSCRQFGRCDRGRNDTRRISNQLVPHAMNSQTITSATDVYELVEQLKVASRNNGLVELGAKLEEAMNLGSSGLEILGAIRNIFIENRPTIERLIGEAGKEQTNQVIVLVDRAFGR